MLTRLEVKLTVVKEGKNCCDNDRYSLPICASPGLKVYAERLLCRKCESSPLVDKQQADLPSTVL